MNLQDNLTYLKCLREEPSGLHKLMNVINVTLTFIVHLLCATEIPKR